MAKAQAPIQSKASVAAGFQKGLDNMCCTSKTIGPSPGNKNIKTRPGVWHPAAEKP